MLPIPSNNNYDEACRKDFKENPGSAFAWALMAGYAYYLRNQSLLSDTTFDNLCKHLFDNYETYEHRYKHIVTKDMLSAGSTYNLQLKDYPEPLRKIAEDLMRRM